MKKICKYIISGALLFSTAVSTTSCSDLLEEKNVSYLTLDDVNTYDMLEILLWGAYQSCQLCYEGNCSVMGNVGTDIHQYVGTGTAYTDVDSYTMTTSSTIPTTFWTRHFAVVADANVVMDKSTQLFEEGIITEEEHRGVYYQALFLRAFAYMRLLQTYGEMPLVDYRMVNISDDVTQIPRSSIYETVQFIENDFLECIESGALPESSATGVSTSRDGTPSSWAARALLARLYLYVGSSMHREAVGLPSGAKQIVYNGTAGMTYELDQLSSTESIMDIVNTNDVISYEDIAPYSGDIIPGYDSFYFDGLTHMDYYRKAQTQLNIINMAGGFSLTSSWHTPFENDYKNTNTESIWEIQFASDVDGAGSAWSKNFGAGGNGTSVWRYNGLAGNTVITPTMTYYKDFKLGDTRRDTYISSTLFTNNTGGSSNLFSSTGASWSPAISVYAPSLGTTATAQLEPDWSYFSETMYGIAASSTATANYVGTMKYSWGTGSTYTGWGSTTHDYDYDECPNNVVVIRWTDVYLMMAEIDMLINGGADPSNPTAVCGTTTAVTILNELMTRTCPNVSSATTSNATVLSTFGTNGTNLAQETYLSTLLTTQSTRLTAMNTSEATFNEYDLTTIGNTTEQKAAYYAAFVSDAMRYQDVTNEISEIQNPSDGSTPAQWVAANMVIPYTTSNLTYEDLIDERGRELGYEFLRWYDLQRLGWLEYKISKRITCLGYNKVVSLTVPKHYLYPIPYANVDLASNPDFLNNPGYN